jgi:hypothetical protein
MPAVQPSRRDQPVGSLTSHAWSFDKRLIGQAAQSVRAHRVARLFFEPRAAVEGRRKK